MNKTNSVNNIKVILESDRKLLYEFVKRMNNSGFFGKYSIKGNILLHYLQYESLLKNSKDFVRLTRDLDIAMFSFKDKPIQYKILELLHGIEIDDSEIEEVEVAKEPGDKRTSWNLKCYKKYGSRNKLQKVFSVDVDSKGFKNDLVQIYSIGDQDFYGSTIEKIAADKLRAISTNSLKNRVKDVFDFDILLRLGFDSNKVLELLLDGGELSDFSFLFNNIDYIKLRLNKLPIQKLIHQYNTERIIEIILGIANIVLKAKENINEFEGKLAFLIKENGSRSLGVKSRNGAVFRTLTGKTILIKGGYEIEYL